MKLRINPKAVQAVQSALDHINFAAYVKKVEMELQRKEELRRKGIRASRAIVYGCLMLSLCGCTVVSNNRVFPKLAWYWSYEAKEQRADNERWERQQREYQRTNTVKVNQ